MDLKNDLNLVALHQREEEISENEMKVTTAGVDNCNTCFDYNVYLEISVGKEAATCPCGSIWVVFGLAL